MTVMHSIVKSLLLHFFLARDIVAGLVASIVLRSLPILQLVLYKIV